MNYTAVKITPPLEISKVDVYATVPSNWLFHPEHSPNEIYVKYLFTSDNNEDNLLLKQLCEVNSPAPEDWMLYACTIIGKADYMFEASELIEKAKSSVKKNSSKGQKKNAKNKVSANEMKKRALADKSHQLHTQFSASIQNIFENVESLPDEEQDGTLHFPDDPFSDKALESGMPVSNAGNPLDATIPDDNETRETPQDALKDKGIKSIERVSSIESISGINGNYISANDLDPKMLYIKLDEISKGIDQISKKITALERSNKGLEKSVLDITNDLHELKTFTMDKRRLKENTNIISFTQLTSLHELELPLQSMNDFKKFEKQLADRDNNLDKDLRTYVISTVNTTIKELEKNLRPIVRSFISKDIALNMTAQKPIANKVTFSTTNFGRILKDCFTNAYADPSIAGPKHFDLAMGTVLNTKKYWSVQHKDAEIVEN